MDNGDQKKPKESKVAQDAEEKTEQKEETCEWKEKYLRALADYQNLDKRIHQELIVCRKRVTKDLLVKFLDILDDIEQGAVFIKDKGLQLVKDKFIKLLTSEGVSEIDMIGKTYDPYTAECVEVIKGEKDSVVVDVLRKGYMLNREVIRPARVKVEKKA